jgi:hypothetical protein
MTLVQSCTVQYDTCTDLHRELQYSYKILQNLTEAHRITTEHQEKCKIIFKVTTTLACTLLTKREREVDYRAGSRKDKQEDQEEEGRRKEAGRHKDRDLEEQRESERERKREKTHQRKKRREREGQLKEEK